MLRSAYLYENRMFTNKVNVATFRVGKGKMVTLIKKGLISAKVCEALEGCTLLKVGPSVPKV